ncbi:MAG: FG-GAP-like repeat-containing protein [Burkholderiaceae bacterium]
MNDRISATATIDLGGGNYGDTSEFSLNLPATPANVAPVIAFPGGDSGFTENGSPVFVDAGATASDADSANFDTGHLVVDFAANGSAEDRLTIVHEGNGAGQVGVSGANVSYGGTLIGSFTGGTDGSTPLDVTFNASADAAAVQAVMRRVAYQAVGEDPSTLTRTVRFTLSDGDGGTSASITKNITLTGDSDLWVNTTSDTADGDASSIQALLADRGADGRISLREAIIAANNTAGPNQIYFDVPEALVGGAHTIALASSLPQITSAVTLDATTEPDFAGTPIVELDGTGAGAAFGLTLASGSDGSSVSGLVINRFSSHGIYILNTGNVSVTGNYVGTDVTGTLDRGNTGTGIMLGNAAHNVQVGGTGVGEGNLVSGNDGAGIEISSATATLNMVLGNRIGTIAAGNAALGNASAGIAITNGANNNVIGGTAAGAGNLISGNVSGIDINGAGTTGNQVIGNRIGTNAAGTAAVANTNVGVTVYNSAHANLIGGATAAHRNIIAGPGLDGIRIISANDTQIQNNYIGTDVTGSVDLGFTQEGVEIQSGTGTIVGGIGLGNLISGNGFAGIGIQGGSGHVVQGNLIGTDNLASGALANDGGGIRFLNTVSDVLIGGENAGEGNTIAHNIGLDGVALSAGTTGVRILGNSIHSNAGEGIDLAEDGITANDPGDADVGSNNLQNYPVLTGAFTDGSGTIAVTGYLNSTSGAAYRIEYFANPGGGDEGEIYLGARDVIVAGSGNASVLASFAAVVGVGVDITATATNLATGETSEFSAVHATSGALIVDTTNDVVDGNTSSVANLLASRGADGFISLREAVIATNNTGGHDAIFLDANTYAFSIAGTAEEFSATGDLDIRDDLTLAGVGSSQTTIDASGLERVLHVQNGANAYITGLTLTGGGNVTDGAGIRSTSGTLVEMTDVVISGNTASGAAGGIDNIGTMYLDRIRVTGNTANEGAGLENLGTAYVTNSLFDANIAATDGGAIQSKDPGSTLELTNVTLSGTSATRGAGAFLDNIALIVHSTITGNSVGDAGGGLFVVSGTTSIGSSIIAGNSAPSGSDAKNTINSLGFNIVGSTSGSSGWVGSDQTGTAPLLGTLADNGGPTPTHALLVGSPAEDAADPSGTLTTDQRGVIRLLGAADVGAFEGTLQQNIVTVTTTSDVVDGNTSSISALLGNMGADGRISLREAMLAANNTANVGSPDEIRFSIPDALVAGAHTIVPTSPLPSLTDAVIIDGSTEPDFAGTPVVEIDGSSAGAAVVGIHFDAGSDGSTIRGLVVNRFTGYGLWVESDGNTIVGNYIGTDVTGSIDRGNGDSGMLIQSAANNVIGGPAVGDGNLISGNDWYGVEFNGATTMGNTVQGNLIGTDAAGTAALGNSAGGVSLYNGASSNQIGGAAAGEGNVISGNTGPAFYIALNAPTGNSVQGNLIGTDVTGTAAIANQRGFMMLLGATGTLIGGTNPGEGNLIANNVDQGIALHSTAGTGNAFLGNRIFANTVLGIDLDGDGVTANDLDDVDAGANDRLNFPVLGTAYSGATTYVSGSYQGLASTDLRLEFFASGVADPSGNGEGERYLGSTSISTDGLGNASFTFVPLAAATVSGEFISATATIELGGGNFGSSSEFAVDVVAVDPAPELELDANDSSGAGGGNFSATFTENGGPVSIADIDATVADPDSANLDSITVTITNLLDGASEVLAANTGGTSITASYVPGTGVLTLSGSDTLANYQQVLRTITYDNTAEALNTAARVVSFVANDGSFSSATVSTTVTVAAVNDPPSLIDTTAFSAHIVTSTAGSPDSVVAADLDADGDMDLAVAWSGVNSTIAWYENDGAQNFALHVIANNAFNGEEVAVADVDGDGDLDVLSASYADDKIAWYENDGSQNFTTHVISSTVDGAEYVGTADVDGDGDVDVLAAAALGDSIIWYENDGSQNFTTHIVTNTANGASSVVAADFDQDGDLDLLTASFDDDTVAWYENDGSQNFTLHVITNTADGAFSVRAVDLDGDGDLDVLSADRYDNMVAWHENDGSQSFSAHVITINSGSAYGVEAADIDGDGDLDVLIPSFVDDTVAWYENDGSQNFVGHIVSTTADGVVSAIAVDLDGDGDLDLASASELNDTIAWYEQLSVTYIEGGAAVLLGAGTTIGDAELDALNAGSGNYAGAALTLVRDGGPNVEDLLGFIDGNGVTLSGAQLLKNGQAIASFDTSTAGQLVVTFTDANGEIPSTADATNVLRQITYANASDTPPGFAQIRWTLDDGNSGLQGAGGAAQATGTTTVRIVATNDPPVITSDGGGATAGVNVAENNAAVTTVTSTDVDGGAPIYTIAAAPMPRCSP